MRDCTKGKGNVAPCHIPLFHEFAMANIPYANLNDPEIASLAERIKIERGGKMLNLYKMLLHSPPVADGWRQLLTAVRQQSILPGRYRELAILRVAVLNQADYEFSQHVPFALADGYIQAQVDALKRADFRDAFDAIDLAVIDYTDAMTTAIRVPKDVFAAVKNVFNDREVMELTTTVAAYNMVSRFLEALQIDHD
jgi:alkylhydroperoxidase family enzyme